MHDKEQFSSLAQADDGESGLLIDASIHESGPLVEKRFASHLEANAVLCAILNCLSTIPDKGLSTIQI